MAAQTGNGNSITPDGILQLGLGFWASKTLLSAVELGVFSELAKEPLDAEILRTRLGLHARAARDFFDALVALRVLDRDDAGRYHNTPETDLFLDRAKPSYVGGMLEMANARLYPFWGNLTAGLRGGEPQNEARSGESFFAALYADPERLRLFLRSMTALSTGPALALAERFPWARYQTFVDVGSAEGGLPVQVARAHPHLTGGGFDLPPVGPAFADFVASQGLSDRLRFYPGDFLIDPLPEADVHVMGHILHDWSEEQRLQLVAKSFAALRPGGVLVVYDPMLDEERRANVFGFLMSLNMLIETPAGSEYAPSQLATWMQMAGFSEIRVEPLVGPETMVIGIRP